MLLSPAKLKLEDKVATISAGESNWYDQGVKRRGIWSTSVSYAQ